jgi:hypothetical protein
MTIVITVTSAFTFGITRYRVPVDIMVVVMAAAGIEGILQRWWPRRDGASLQRLRRGAPAGTIDGFDQDPDPAHPTDRTDPAAPLPPDAPSDPPTEALVHG